MKGQWMTASDTNLDETHSSGWLTSQVRRAARNSIIWHGLVRALYHVGSQEAEVIAAIERKHPDLAGRFLPIMLNHEAVFPVIGYIGLIIGVPLTLLCFFNIGKAVWALQHPASHRNLMAVLPVAVDDSIYNTAMNTTLVAGTYVTANDFEANGTAITASVVANPSHGTLSAFGSNGSFTYVPTTSYVGLDSFTYKVNNGSFDSNVATVSIAVGGVFGPRTNLDDQPLDSPMYTGANTVTQDLSLGQRLVYRSDT